MPRNLAIMLFDDAEVLDFCGPYEVFSISRDRENGDTPFFNVYTVAENAGPVLARNGLSINPDYTVANCPKPDIFLVPGGRGTRKEMYNDVLLDWIKTHAQDAELVLSVCTGSMMLARAGVLDGLSATTHHGSFEEFESVAPNVELCRGERFVDNGKVVTSAGISAGIDMSLYIVSRLHGAQHAITTAKYMEYDIKTELLTDVPT